NITAGGLYVDVGDVTFDQKLVVNGNVGIGTTSPGNLLDVNGSGNFDSLYVQATSTMSSLIATSTLEVRGASGSTLWVEDGSVGIGTTGPSAPLHISAAAVANRGQLSIAAATTNVYQTWYEGSTYQAYIQYNSGDFNIQNYSNGSYGDLTLNASGGNVGIGTTSPAALLAVGGNAYITGNVGIGTAGPVSLITSSTKFIDIEAATGGAGITMRVSGESPQEFSIQENGGQVAFDIAGATTAANNFMIFRTEDTASQYTPTERLRIASDGTFTGSATNDISDERLKENVAIVGSALDKIVQLRGVSFNWKPEAEMHNRTQFGVLAQEVETVFPELVLDNSIREGYKSVQYSGFVAPFIESIKELNLRTGFIQSSLGTTTAMFVTSDGNVGIGSTTPSYKLAVMGDVAATSFINISTRTAKKDIEYLDDGDESDVLSKIRDTRVATYNYLSDNNQDTRYNNQTNTNDQNSITKGKARLGLIAEEAPVEVLSIDGKGVDIYKLSSFILAGVKAQQMQIDELKSDVASIKSSLSSLAIPLAPAPSVQDTSIQTNSNASIFKQIITIAKSTLAAITSTMGDWANAVLADSTQLKVTSEDETDTSYETYGVTGSRDEIIASGSATLQGLTLGADQGQTFTGARIKFDASFTSLISESEPIKVIVTPTTRLNGSLYVHEKTRFGFEIREINAYDEGGMFDWMVVARKKGAEDAVAPITPIEPIVTPPADSETLLPPAEPVVTEPPPAEEPIAPPAEEVIPPAEEIVPPAEEPVVPPAEEPTP
ncbi:MAG: tail fiber domain-containing protein, partial [Minisyncoccia bacterium]